MNAGDSGAKRPSRSRRLLYFRKGVFPLERVLLWHWAVQLLRILFVAWLFSSLYALGRLVGRLLGLTSEEAPGRRLIEVALGLGVYSAIVRSLGAIGLASREVVLSILLVSTHLETSQYPDVQLGQARELLAGVLETDRPVVLIGDLNTRAPAAPAYRMLLDAGFVDAWTTIQGDDPGFTCCQQADLRNPESSLYERIDLVVFRGPFEVLRATRTGETSAARTGSGLWPSDHAGVVATVELRPN